MNREPENELSSELHDDLRALTRGPEPSGRLEDRVVHVLKQRGFLHDKPTHRTPWMRWLVTVATCLVIFAAGFFLGRHQRSATLEPAGDRFVLFLYRSTSAVELDPSERAKRVHEYAEWALQQRDAGNLVVGEKLNDKAFELSGVSTSARVPANSELVSGYFVIAAPNLDAALAISRTCPHLHYGGRVVLRPIERVS